MPLGEGHGEKEWMDENECLNVNVTVPKAALEERGKAKGLPVFVWVHGGGLSIGSNSWPQYNLTRLIERSIEIGKPVIGVSINYRLGVLGFLTSRELGTDGNYGFKDQLLAFRWVKKHIAGFGGDPNNITAAAESAGGISLSTLLCADVGEGLFDRVVIMSGETTLRKPRSRAWHEEMYQDQLKLLSLQEANVGERTRILRSMPAEELQSKLPLAQHFCACVDGKFLKEDVTLSRLSNGKRRQHKPAWCKEFVIGDTAHDVSAFEHFGSHRRANKCATVGNLSQNANPRQSQSLRPPQIPLRPPLDFLRNRQSAFRLQPPRSLRRARKAYPSRISF